MANSIIKNKNSKIHTVSGVELRRLIIEAVYEILNDPDFGLELQDWVKERLKKRPKKTISFEEIKKKYK
ncbi:MAG: hypothetical protein CEN87_366 [Parcubacteria group bacterium Licking1014_1]|nr:MAG: hypothetical protein CEN87_366 [Parcubacteria group bacterium Licking1014_1]